MTKILLGALVVCFAFSSRPAHAWNPNNQFGIIDLTRGAYEFSTLNISFCDRPYNLSDSLRSLCQDALGYVQQLDWCAAELNFSTNNYSTCLTSLSLSATNYNSCMASLNSITGQLNTLQQDYESCASYNYYIDNQFNLALQEISKRKRLERALRRACGSKCNRIR